RPRFARPVIQHSKAPEHEHASRRHGKHRLCCWSVTAVVNRELDDVGHDQRTTTDRDDGAGKRARVGRVPQRVSLLLTHGHVGIAAQAGCIYKQPGADATDYNASTGCAPTKWVAIPGF